MVDFGDINQHLFLNKFICLADFLLFFFLLINIVISKKKIMFVVAFVCLLASLLIHYERIVMKFHGGVWGGKRNKWLNFGGKKDFTKFLKACSRQGAAILHGGIVVIQE